jgi:hypothetical protein
MPKQQSLHYQKTNAAPSVNGSANERENPPIIHDSFWADSEPPDDQQGPVVVIRHRTRERIDLVLDHFKPHTK